MDRLPVVITMNQSRYLNIPFLSEIKVQERVLLLSCIHYLHGSKKPCFEVISLKVIWKAIVDSKISTAHIIVLTVILKLRQSWIIGASIMIFTLVRKGWKCMIKSLSMVCLK